MAEVNLDVAMESTSQEILEKVEDVYKSSVVENPNVLICSNHGTGAVNNNKVLDITGKGKLFFAMLGSTAAGNGVGPLIKVTVDGKVIAHAKAHCGFSSSYAARCGIINPYFIYGEDNKYADMPLNSEAGSSHSHLLFTSSIGASVKYLQFSEELQTYAPAYNGAVDALFLVDAPILFESGLQIEITYAQASAYAYTIGYKLDE